MAAKLPGIRFKTEPNIPEETLPRMDIAAFVGFASSGPLNVPVPVEDMAGFRDIFGDDLPLALDESLGKMQCALLSGAVESFFINGGRRCWVVRVANGSVAKHNHFFIPGLAVVYDDKILQAQVHARSEGSWSDDMMAGAVLEARPVTVKSFVFKNNTYTLEIYSEVSAGDLLRLETGNKLLFFFVESVEKDSTDPKNTFFRSKGSQGYWFTECPSIINYRKAEVFLNLSDDVKNPHSCKFTCPDDNTPFYRIELSIPQTEIPDMGSLLRIDIDQKNSIFLTVSGVEMVDESSQMVVLKGKYALCQKKSQKPLFKNWSQSSLNKLTVNILSFELIAYHGNERIGRMENLSFMPSQPRFIGKLPTDSALFSTPDRTALETETSFPRFPFASPFEKIPTEKIPKLCLPIGMPDFFDKDILTSAIKSPKNETDLERNGLSKFTSGLFIDQDLSGTTSASVLNEANFKYYQGTPGKPLKGIHSLLPVEEITIVAVPDAVLPGWGTEEPVPAVDLLSPPELEEPVLSEDKNTYPLNWSRVVGAESYTFQESNDAAFETVRRQQDHITTDREETISLVPDNGCPDPVYFRVRAACGNRISAWSNTVHIIKPLPDFTCCQVRLILPPVLEKDNPILIKWNAVEGGESYVLQESKDPEFISAIDIYSGNETTFILRRNDSRLYYYRVLAEGEAGYSAWSNTVNSETTRVSPVVMKNPLKNDNDRDEVLKNLLQIHRGLLQFCCARGDMFAVLALPIHFLESDALSYKSVLENCPGEENITSFGAIYHPWFYSGIQGKNNPDSINLLPPDGAVCGKIASVSAWLAPANVSIQGAVSLKPAIDTGGWERLYPAGINLIRQEPRGFLIMIASTLSKDPRLSLINVRRLLILLRRLALREGAIYTFQPNDGHFRRLVRHRFEMLLGNMFMRGAFAGRTPEESFRVVADSSINTIQSIEVGRFIIELQVAPSLPMTFITVRLVQTGNYGLMIKEV
ncbi:Uncharacterised protein [uncultured archaeon]|nr:Uncharacterised protein [uncultured archaeon]